MPTCSDWWVCHLIFPEHKTIHKWPYLSWKIIKIDRILQFVADSFSFLSSFSSQAQITVIDQPVCRRHVVRLIQGYVICHVGSPFKYQNNCFLSLLVLSKCYKYSWAIFNKKFLLRQVINNIYWCSNIGMNTFCSSFPRLRILSLSINNFSRGNYLSVQKSRENCCFDCYLLHFESAGLPLLGFSLWQRTLWKGLRIQTGKARFCLRCHWDWCTVTSA